MRTRPRSELTLFIWGLLAFPRQGAFLGHTHTPELRLRIVWVNLLMIGHAGLSNFSRPSPTCCRHIAL
jgi:hypothetical protein